MVDDEAQRIAQLRTRTIDHVRRYVESGGANGHITPSGVPALILTTTGRRSGRPHPTALFYGQDGDRYVVVASRGGSKHHPDWYLNLAANEAVEVQVLDRRFPARARTATGAERERLWRLMAKLFPKYDEYRQTTAREIPVVVIEPVE